MRWPSVVAALVLVLAGACGSGGGDEDDVLVGRVDVLDSRRACVTPDRGETSVCIERAESDLDAVEGLEVGVCAELTNAFNGPKSIRVRPAAACAAGDLGG